MQVYEITFGESLIEGDPPQLQTAEPYDTRLFIADNTASAVAAAEEWIGGDQLYVRYVHDLGRVRNCYQEA